MRNVRVIDPGKAGGGNPSPWPHVAMHHSNTHKAGRRRKRRKRRGSSTTAERHETHNFEAKELHLKRKIMININQLLTG